MILNNQRVDCQVNKLQMENLLQTALLLAKEAVQAENTYNIEEALEAYKNVCLYFLSVV